MCQLTNTGCPVAALGGYFAGLVTAVEPSHDEAKRLGGGEYQRRQPDALVGPVAAIRFPARLHRDAGLVPQQVQRLGSPGLANPNKL